MHRSLLIKAYTDEHYLKQRLLSLERFNACYCFWCVANNNTLQRRIERAQFLSSNKVPDSILHDSGYRSRYAGFREHIKIVLTSTHNSP